MFIKIGARLQLLLWSKPSACTRLRRWRDRAGSRYLQGRSAFQTGPWPWPWCTSRRRRTRRSRDRMPPARDTSWSRRVGRRTVGTFPASDSLPKLPPYWFARTTWKISQGKEVISVSKKSRAKITSYSKGRFSKLHLVSHETSPSGRYYQEQNKHSLTQWKVMQCLLYWHHRYIAHQKCEKLSSKG